MRTQCWWLDQGRALCVIKVNLLCISFGSKIGFATYLYVPDCDGAHSPRQDVFFKCAPSGCLFPHHHSLGWCWWVCQIHGAAVGSCSWGVWSSTWLQKGEIETSHSMNHRRVWVGRALNTILFQPPTRPGCSPNWPREPSTWPGIEPGGSALRFVFKRTIRLLSPSWGGNKFPEMNRLPAINPHNFCLLYCLSPLCCTSQLMARGNDDAHSMVHPVGSNSGWHHVGLTGLLLPSENILPEELENSLYVSTVGLCSRSHKVSLPWDVVASCSIPDLQLFPRLLSFRVQTTCQAWSFHGARSHPVRGGELRDASVAGDEIN